MKKFFLALLAMFMLALPAQAENDEQNLRLPIVMYHHMSPKARLWGDYVISLSQFESDLIYLREQGYTPITTAELIAWCDGVGRLPEKPCMITFDDGFESTFVYAQPLLEKYGMKAVVSIIGSVSQQYSETPDHMLDYSHISWEAAAQADAAGTLEVQCHTWDMHDLDRRCGCAPLYGEDEQSYSDALSADIGRFREVYESHMGHGCNVLALPFGFYKQQTLDNAQALGFRAVFTCTERVNLLTGARQELMELGRFNRPSGVTSEQFFAKWNT